VPKKANIKKKTNQGATPFVQKEQEADVKMKQSPAQSRAGRKRFLKNAQAEQPKVQDQ
jgi:hypothetical protein